MISLSLNPPMYMRHRYETSLRKTIIPMVHDNAYLCTLSTRISEDNSCTLLLSIRLASLPAAMLRSSCRLAIRLFVAEHGKNILY
jgi:hypothetical protein